MTEQRRHPDEPGDPRVSQVYRQLAGERTPEHLDHAVLNAAREAAKARGRGPMFWLRPVAWVTTIGLCLAIVLEIAHVPREEAEFERILEDRQLEQSTPPAVSLPATPPAGTANEAKSLPARNEVEAAKRLDKSERNMPAMSAGRTAAMPAAEETDAPPAAQSSLESTPGTDEAVRDDAGSQAPGSGATFERAQSTALQEPVPARASRDPAADRYCDDSRTADPESWLACILELEQQGLHDAARVERERLAAAFPPPETP